MTVDPQQQERARHEAMIEKACGDLALTIDEWSLDGDNSDRVRAHLGRWQPAEDMDDVGLYPDDAGELTASVVGGREHGNERVCFWFANEDFEGAEVRPEYLEPEA